ncbi:MAG: AsmA-like C-terminal domain-containing protein [Desulfobacterales bacterium]|nr:MAG: AsmA-like C-terminal domain-containing protein [Desulfobacterales bacterium]
MRTSKKIYIGLLGGAGFLLLLLLLTIPLSRWIANQASVRAAISRQFSQKVGGEIEYRAIDLSFLPRPHAVLHEVRLAVPARIAGTIASIEVYPQIGPLLRGNLQIAKLRFASPAWVLKITPRPGSAQTAAAPSALIHAMEEFRAAILALPSFRLAVPTVQVEDGRLDVFDRDRRILGLHAIQTALDRSGQRSEYSIICRSNLWESISIDGWIDSANLQSAGRIDLNDFQPQNLSAYLFPDSLLKLTDANVSLNLAFYTDGPERLHLNLEGSLPYIALRRPEKKLIVKGQNIKGTIELDQESTRIALEELVLDYPQLQATGYLSATPAAPHASLALEARQIDVESVRAAALTLAGTNEDIKDLFEVLQGGRVPQMTVKAEGNSIHDLGRTQNIVVRGQLLKGKIFIPKAELNLEQVVGDAVIARGILEGRNLKARMGNSTGQNGSLRLGLTGPAKPFHLEIPIRGDLTQLPPVLKRVVKDPTFQKELARIKNFTGSAVGTLELGENLKALQARAKVSQLSIHGSYDRIPFPIQARGGAVFLEGTRLAVEKLDAAIGKSALNEITGHVDWGPAPSLEAAPGSARIVLDEIYPWLLSLEKLREPLQGFTVTDGIVVLEHLDLKGPIFKPREWRWQSAGKIEDLAVTSALLGDPLRISAGKFKAAPSTGRDGPNQSIVLELNQINWGKRRLTLDGQAAFAAEHLLLDMDLTANGIDWDVLSPIVNHINRHQKDEADRKNYVQGSLRVKSDYFRYHDYQWQPIQVVIVMEAQDTQITITRADLCGLSLSGLVKISPPTIESHLLPVSHGQDLDLTLACLADKKALATGSFDLSGELRGRSPPSAWPRSTSGNLAFAAREGRILRFGLLAKILALLNFTEIYKGQLPDLMGEGFAYNHMQLKGDLHGGKIALTECALDGESMGIACEGDIDIVNKKIDLVVLVAPFKTADRIIKLIPLVNTILGGKLISIPFHAMGDLADPLVIPLSPTAVGSGVLGVLERTLKLPITIIQPILPDRQKRNDGQKEPDPPDTEGQH